MNLCHEAVDVADRQWTRKFVQEPADHKDVAAFPCIDGPPPLVPIKGSEQ
jgi:hypothetical protein